MPDAYNLEPAANPAGGVRGPAGLPPIVIQNHMSRPSGFGRIMFRSLLVLSLLANFILMGFYVQHYAEPKVAEQFLEGEKFAADKIAVIKVDMGMITSDTIAPAKKELKAAAKDPDVKAIVLVVDSPGGTIGGSDELYHAIEEFKQTTNRPIVVSMQGMATSGAYYISMPADKIFADRSCITGSIGVIASMMNFEKLLKNWGVDPEVVKSGKMKDSGSPFRAMTDEDRKEWQKLINGMYSQFLAVILKYRATKIGGEEKLRQLADGRVYLATDAKSLGLIDDIGYQEDAVAAAKQLAGLSDKVRIFTYSRPLGGWLGTLLGVSAPASDRLVATEKLLELARPRLLLLPPSFLSTAP